MLWSTIDNVSNRRSVYFKLEVRYKHSEIKEQAGKDIEKITIDFFRNRGFILASTHTVKDAIYYAAYFYQMLLAKEGIEVEVVDAFADFGAWWKTDFLPGPRVHSDEWLSRKSVLTYQW